MTVAKQWRHALQRRIAAGEHVHRNRDQHVEQPKLWHRTRHCPEKHPDSGCEEQIDHDADQKQRDRAGNRNAKEAADHKSQRRRRRTVMTKPFAQIFDIAISKGVSGMTSRWSIVPCSRSRIMAAPARMIASIVTLLMIAMTLVNQVVREIGIERDADVEIDRRCHGLVRETEI